MKKKKHDAIQYIQYELTNAKKNQQNTTIKTYAGTKIPERISIKTAY